MVQLSHLLNKGNQVLFIIYRVPTGQGNLGKVGEFCKMVREIKISSKVREKSGNFKIMLG